ncbi:hypothetical protein DFH06DRAFT_1129366 [Mycena polygramma]|nr:hypothetical protein DFH06DRAFT_1129366 [Mycena polygramma]
MGKIQSTGKGEPAFKPATKGRVGWSWGMNEAVLNPQLQPKSTLRFQYRLHEISRQIALLYTFPVLGVKCNVPVKVGSPPGRKKENRPKVFFWNAGSPLSTEAVVYKPEASRGLRKSVISRAPDLRHQREDLLLAPRDQAVHAPCQQCKDTTGVGNPREARFFCAQHHHIESVPASAIARFTVARHRCISTVGLDTLRSWLRMSVASMLHQSTTESASRRRKVHSDRACDSALRNQVGVRTPGVDGKTVRDTRVERGFENWNCPHGTSSQVGVLTPGVDGKTVRDMRVERGLELRPPLQWRYRSIANERAGRRKGGGTHRLRSKEEDSVIEDGARRHGKWIQTWRKTYVSSGTGWILGNLRSIQSKRAAFDIFTVVLLHTSGSPALVVLQSGQQRVKVQRWKDPQTKVKTIGGEYQSGSRQRASQRDSWDELPAGVSDKVCAGRVTTKGQIKGQIKGKWQLPRVGKFGNDQGAAKQCQAPITATSHNIFS